MPIPTEPIGSIPRTPELIQALSVKDCDDPSLMPLYEAAIRDTVARFEATGSPVVTDGEMTACFTGPVAKRWAISRKASA